MPTHDHLIGPPHDHTFFNEISKINGDTASLSISAKHVGKHLDDEIVIHVS